MAAGTAAIVGGGLAAGGLLQGMMGNRAMAGAAGASAAAQAAQAQRIEAYGQGLETRVNDAAKMSPQELMAYEKSLNAASQTVDADSKMLAAVDPALLEASSQALSLIRGQDAAALTPIRNQRTQQRDQLLRTLRQQLGPGAETTSAGMKALSQFDMETSSLLSQTQQSTLGMFLSSAQNQRNQIGNNIGTLQNAGSAFGNASSRQANYMLNAGQSTMNAMGGVMQTAGSPFVSAMVQGQGQQAMGNQFLGIGTNLLGQGLLGGGFGGSKPPDTPQIGGSRYGSQAVAGP